MHQLQDVNVSGWSWGCEMLQQSSFAVWPPTCLAIMVHRDNLPRCMLLTILRCKRWWSLASMQWLQKLCSHQLLLACRHTDVDAQLHWTATVCLQHHLCRGAAGSGRSRGQPGHLRAHHAKTMILTAMLCLQHHLCGGAAGPGRGGGRPGHLHVARRRRPAQPAAAHEQLHPPQRPERVLLADLCDQLTCHPMYSATACSSSHHRCFYQWQLFLCWLSTSHLHASCLV